MADKRFVTSWILAALTGLAFIGAGAMKLINLADSQEMLGTLGVPGWAVPAIGVYEVLFGILVLIPKTRHLGAAFLLADMAVAFLVHLVNADWAGAPPSFVLGVLSGVLVWLHWDRLKALLSR